MQNPEAQEEESNLVAQLGDNGVVSGGAEKSHAVGVSVQKAGPKKGAGQVRAVLQQCQLDPGVIDQAHLPGKIHAVFYSPCYAPVLVDALRTDE